jgi:hypothetical protein
MHDIEEANQRLQVLLRGEESERQIKFYFGGLGTR